jgi:hypothetical protein
MTTMMDRLKALRAKASRAASRAKTKERALYRHGQPLFDYERHQAMLKAIKGERNKVLAEVRSEVLAIIRAQKHQLEVAHDFPRDSVLDYAARSSVLSRLPLIQSELDRMNA